MTPLAAMAAPGTSPRTPVDWTRKHALATGLFYLITFATRSRRCSTSSPPSLTTPNYIVNAGADTRVVIGSLLDAVNTIACVGTAPHAQATPRRHRTHRGPRPGRSQHTIGAWTRWQCLGAMPT